MFVTITPMTLQDLDAVVAIEGSSFVQPWSRQSFSSELANSQLAAYLVARVAGRVVGYGGVWVILDEAHLTTLAVENTYRSKGIASRLLSELIDKSLEMGARRMSLEVRPSNQSARGLYHKFGFIVKGLRKHYYFNEDGLVMFKENLAEERGGHEPAS